ncbi:MAG: DUF1207 domain-containing protein [Thermoanaerobaculia bacterium]|nr:DUF1207 domain-containing protein [Thermoanaerobaculia bacterium]
MAARVWRAGLGIGLLWLGVTAAGAADVTWYPEDDLFYRLVADPKTPQNFTMVADLEQEAADESITAWLVGIGETFGIYRLDGDDDAWSLQLEIFAAAFAQFDLTGPSNALLNTDYQVGGTVALRRGRFSSRFRMFHQSSHLGDELILGPDPPERVNLSYEAVDAMVAVEIKGWRPYLGGSYAVRVSPDRLDRGLAHAGIEYGHPSGWFFAVDAKWLQERDWDPGVSVMTGYRVGRNKGPLGRAMSLRLVYYDGVSPYGQFFAQDTEYLGGGMWFRF